MEGSSESESTVDRGIQFSRAKVKTVAESGRGRWPFDADELMVFRMDVATAGHSVSESTDGARSHRFLPNK